MKSPPATFTARRAAVLRDLAISTLRDPLANPLDITAAEQILNPPRVTVGALTAAQRNELRALLRVLLGEPPLPGGEPPAGPDAAAPPPPIEVTAAPAAQQAPAAPDLDELGSWPSPVR